MTLLILRQVAYSQPSTREIFLNQKSPDAPGAYLTG